MTAPPSLLARSLRSAPLLLCGAMFFIPAARAEEPTGAQVYEQKCAACHGDRGQGTPDYPTPLLGDRGVGDLADVITKTMPEGSPEDCVGDEAKRVAAYVHETFYSELAQARNAPARVELARLTVRQYQNAVADLVGGFGQQAKDDGEPGLRAKYGKGSRMVNRQGVFDRVDPKIDFDWGEDGPDKEKLGSEEVAIDWAGALFAPETGNYEFAIESTCGVRLRVNTSGRDKPLIDGAVRSGDVPLRETIRLIGGRSYPISLDMQKSKRDKTAAVKLKWTPPGGVEEVIPGRFFTTADVPPVLVLDTPFPPDDRSTGYERGTRVSKAWDEATTYAALEVAVAIDDRLRDLTGIKNDDPEREKKLKDFLGRFVERAFRRPLTDDEKQFFIENQFAAAGGNSDLALKRVVILALKSPRFLYREVGVPQNKNGYEVASRLSFTLWDSIPDKELLAAAARGELDTRDRVARQAERMIASPRAKAKLRDFLHGWLQLSRFHDLAKNAELFPEFDQAIVADLRTSLDLFLDDVLWGDNPDFRRLLTEDTLYLNGRLAKFYGADLPADAEFQVVKLNPGERAGVLTHPYLMTGFSYFDTTSPIHRGVFLARSLLGRSLKPPPMAVSPVAPDLHPSLTTRERTLLQTSPDACATCHNLINPLGFSLERFDAVGRLRTEEKTKPIDAAGGYRTRDDAVVNFTGGSELGGFLASSDEVRDAFVSQLFQYAVKQPIRAYGENTTADLRKRFAEEGCNVRRLLVNIAVTAALPDAEAR